MPTKPLMPNVQDLLEQSSCGADMLIHWLAAARDDLAQRNDELDALVPAALQDKLVKERQRVSARVCNFAPNTVRPRTRAVWFGLMQKATRTGYNIATYAAISQDTSLTDPEWEASAKMQGENLCGDAQPHKGSQHCDAPLGSHSSGHTHNLAACGAWKRCPGFID